MIKAIIIEDEKTALDNLLYHIRLTKEPVSVIGTMETVSEAVEWLAIHPAPDLIFMDVYLKDGISFEIFDRIKVLSPVIFTTAFDNFMLKAFEQTGIEYLLKPIDERELSRAIGKFKNLQLHFVNSQGKLVDYPIEKDNGPKQRMVVKKGIEFQSIALDEVAYFFTDQKISFLVNKEGKKFLVNKTLKEIEDELDSRKFYRVNRKYIVNINYIKSYKPFDRIKIQVELSIPVSEEIIISQESAIDFRQWIANL